MISEKEKKIIITYAKKYNISTIYLFGSALNDNGVYNDIDIAVLGLKPCLFFKFYGELLRNLSKTVDLVDLSRESLFNQMIKERGVRIYG